MRASEISALRRRWSDTELATLRQQLIEQSRVSKPPHALRSEWPDTPDGLTDLRGLNAGKEGVDIRYVTLQRLDLSFSQGAITAFEAEFFNCRFDSVTFTGQPRLNRRLEGCTFRNAKLARLTLGPRVIDCDFTGAKLARMRSAPNTLFERCSFDLADLAGAEFADASFVDCTMRDTQFTASTTFTRCSFENTGIDFGAAQVNRSHADGAPLADQWAGEAEASAALERYARAYARAPHGDHEGL